MIEFGNDEVYYWLYALQPDISHFDHPPMVGFFIQFFTANLYFDSELWIRLAAIIPSGISMWAIYKIGSLLKGTKAGLFSVLLYHLSIYGFVISGIFILPDSPLVLFWLLAFYYFLRVLPFEPDREKGKFFLLAMFFVGLALYSKYQAVFLLLGVVVYIVLFRKSWLQSYYLYLGFLFPLLAVGLIFYWNYTNDFISFTFHGNRVSLLSLDFKLKYFFKEVIGQFVYNNPYVVVILICALLAFVKKRVFIEKSILYFFLLSSLPLIVTVLYLSLYKSTLPHWSGVAYLTLIPLGGAYLSSINSKIKPLLYGILGLCMLVFLTANIVNRGWLLPVEKTVDNTKLGKKDFTLDMYGWRQSAEKINIFINENKELSALPIVIDQWYPGSHIDYYYAKPFDKKLAPLGSLKNIHKYYWSRGEDFTEPEEAIFITDSKNHKDPKAVYKNYKTIELRKKIDISRNRIVVKHVFVYYLKK